MSIHWSVETSCMIRLIGNNGARSAGPIGSLVMGLKGGSGATFCARSGMMLNHADGTSSGRRSNRVRCSLIGKPPPSPRPGREPTVPVAPWLSAPDGRMVPGDATSRALRASEGRVDSALIADDLPGGMHVSSTWAPRRRRGVRSLGRPRDDRHHVPPGGARRRQRSVGPPRLRRRLGHAETSTGPTCVPRSRDVRRVRRRGVRDLGNPPRLRHAGVGVAGRPVGS